MMLNALALKREARSALWERAVLGHPRCELITTFWIETGIIGFSSLGGDTDGPV